MPLNLQDIIKLGFVGSGSGGGSSGGGGGGSAPAVSPKEVNFYDYDGTCVHAYTVAEAQALSELPAGPEHPGLVFQGWNWSLEGVKGLTRAMNIGAMYTTDDGTTRLYITLQEDRTSPMLGVGVNGTVTVDWGDGTEPDVLTGTNVTTTQWTSNHAYAAPGDYVIRLTVDGWMSFRGHSSVNQYARILRHATGSDARNRVYHAALKRVEIGSNVSSIGDYGFASCVSLETITIPANVTSIGESAFQSCFSFMWATLPENVTSVASYTFHGCYSMETLALSENVASIAYYVFTNCYTLAKLTIPDSVTTINNYLCGSCYPMGSITIPSGLTSLGKQAFVSCESMVYYDFTACTAVPSMEGTETFKNISADCEIRVPAALYDEWIAATNWSTYADYIKAY